MFSTLFPLSDITSNGKNLNSYHLQAFVYFWIFNFSILKTQDSGSTIPCMKLKQSILIKQAPHSHLHSYKGMFLYKKLTRADNGHIPLECYMNVPLHSPQQQSHIYTFYIFSLLSLTLHQFMLSMSPFSTNKEEAPLLDNIRNLLKIKLNFQFF